MAFQKITLTIPGALEHIGALGTSVRALASAMGVDDGQAFQIELAAVEATTNAIRHALPNEPDPWVALDVEIEPDRMILTLRNPGAEMDPAYLEKAEAPSMEVADDLASFPEGGMGLALIKEVMNDVAYSRKDEINHFCMVFTTK